MNIPYSPYNPDTRRLWPYIKMAYIKHITVSKIDHARGYIIYEGRPYTLVDNHKTLIKALSSVNIWSGQVSLQQHNSGNYAVLR